MKVHTGVKEYKCDVCFKEFTQKRDLNRHIKLHSGVEDYKCSVCLKEFPRKTYMKVHVVV